MRDKKLVWMLALLTLFVTAHNVDHLIRDGVSTSLLVVVGVIYALIGVTFWLYWKNKIGVRFFTVVAIIGFAFGWLGHFSPSTTQPPTYILSAYSSALAGWLALSSLFGVMAALAVIALYGGYRWSKRT